MELRYEIPGAFWGLFRSGNRDIYIESLLRINEEYEYNNYFLSREACVRILADMCSESRIYYEQEENETETDLQETYPKRILNWLLRAKWLKKLDDFTTMTTNIVIPDYAAVFIDAFDLLANEPMEDTDIYIQNVYATLFSFKHDKHRNLSMLRTALVNTRKLNKALQDMLHNMDSYFGRLLEKQTYGELLAEHLDGYVEEVVKKKYHILKTSDNFYIYKMDIKNCLKEMREDLPWIEKIREKEKTSCGARKGRDEDVLDLIDRIERGFDDIEHRIANMDREHSKYVRATVSRLNYLLSEDSDRKGLLIQLLNRLSEDEGPRLARTGEKLRLTSLTLAGEGSLFKRRRRRNFPDEALQETEEEELTKEEVLKLNKIHVRYSEAQIEAFIEENMTEGRLDTALIRLSDEESFEKLILAYDMSTRKKSKYEVYADEEEKIHYAGYTYPKMVFVRKMGRENT